MVYAIVREKKKGEDSLCFAGGEFNAFEIILKI
jgi:hypothetical protein